MNDFMTPENYINRELSWLDFNMRVLCEARDKSHPLFERLRFLAITGSNLDEFFMVRVASLKKLAQEKNKKKDAAGMTAQQQLNTVSEKAHRMIKRQYGTYSRLLLPALEKENILIISREQLNDEQRRFVRNIFKDEIYPLLMPVVVDSSRYFPLIRNNVLNICAFIKKKNKKNTFATVQVPQCVPRLIRIPDRNNKHTFILSEEIIKEFISHIFKGFKVNKSAVYRVIRDADIPINEDRSEDLLIQTEKDLKKREYSRVIRLEVESGISKKLLEILKKELKIGEEDIYKISGPVDITFLNELYSEHDFLRFKYSPFKAQLHPRMRENENIFSEICKGDLMFHHPYDSFDSIVRLVSESAKDKNVISIKLTLYRVSRNSRIVAALIKAAENGKQVTVLMEIKARFDEKNNIEWARKLEKAGCHVIYGIEGLKTHSKIIEVVRQEKDCVRRYVHLGTGNYNEVTAQMYTDMGILTCCHKIGEDADAFFNMLSGCRETDKWNRLIIAPVWLRKRTKEMIEREIKYAKKGKKARIIAKMNSLTDPEITALLYKASCAGVKIELIIRGICVLRAGVPGLSENITVRSIIGRYLEHTRIYYFYNNGREDVYCASADLMQRNLNRRVEIMFPIEDKDLKKKVINILNIQLADNMRSYIQHDGEYKKVDLRGKKKLDCMEYFMKMALDDIKATSKNLMYLLKCS